MKLRTGYEWESANVRASKRGKRRRARRYPHLLATTGLAVAGLVAADAVPVRAQSVDEARNFPVERFHLSTDRNGLLGVEWAGLRTPKSWEVSLWLGGADDPLVVYRGSGSNRERVGELVGMRFGGELAASYAFNTWLQLSVSIPLVIYQTRDANLAGAAMPLESIGGVGLGDIRIAPKVALLRQGRHGLNLSLLGELGVPSGAGTDYRGDDGVSGGASLLVSRRQDAWKFAGVLGYWARQRTEVINQIVDDEILLRAGVGWVHDKLEVDATVSLATAAAAPFDRFNQNHLEFIAGPNYEFGGKWIVFAGAGVGALAGFGTPDFRALAGLRIGKLTDDGDLDKDGIADSRDACKNEAEDRDGSRDSDGCPDLDDDSDGIADLVDKCKNEPEDKDTYQDEDGCPDLDNDADGLADASDKCPLEAEVVNGVQDDDGCPDVGDKDQDGLADNVDKCPAEAEDKDGFQDEDGCPENDNDADGVPDAADKCPIAAGPVENQGCPDTDRDKDGVVDRLDNCPDEAGDAKFQGCKKKQLVVISQGKLDILDVVYFKFNRDEILAKSNPLLDNVAAVLNSHMEIKKVQVQGHTDDRGNDAYNLDLSDRRAKQVMRYLIAKGVDPARLEAKGYGETQPIADNKTLKGRGANRRVVFQIVGEATGVEMKNSGPTKESADQ